jgi:hypothetical protein
MLTARFFVFFYIDKPVEGLSSPLHFNLNDSSVEFVLFGSPQKYQEPQKPQTR